ncbi:Proline iminopeptidase [Martelella mediterranea DSM 17316]|uniref:Proline iminopeptidase n=2 Tax=Martelella mediterranea TaxID=293089 RepID=A0A1U9YYK2_9HYPH|nr:alpha/beta fold hydrolase [Martelella mediterranea]AQZ50519.1 Proline iminopeptidase [Martelella mediterranea DSM 17316]
MMPKQYIIPGMMIRDMLVPVPLDWSRPEGPVLQVFAREIVDPVKRRENLPVLAFLQGGPGGKSPRPVAGGPPWLQAALKTHRVVLIDQRGTGRSSPIDGHVISRFENGEAAADYLMHFRADSIVADCEHIRKQLLGDVKWETLGQSFGGFITLTYLSRAPEGLAACYVTGGLAGLAAEAEEVYRRTYPRVLSKNRRYYQRYPEDERLAARIADFIEDNPVYLPDGDRLSVRRLQTLGLGLGMGPGHEVLHFLLDEAFADPDETRLSESFLFSVMAETGFAGNPLFAVLQESIYAQGPRPTASAAERIRGEFPRFDPARRPLLFTGEMIYPWMFEEIRSLRPFSAAVEVLAARTDNPPLYDATRLFANDVPVAAAVYHDDMYVDAGLSLETANRLGNCRTWVTNEYEHDGVRQSPAVFERLREMVMAEGGPHG